MRNAMRFRLAVPGCVVGERCVTSLDVTLHEAQLFSLRGTTATFVCKCPGCPDNHIVSRRVPALRYRTNTHTDPRTKMPIEGTPYTVAIPLTISLAPYNYTEEDKPVFVLGDIAFYPVFGGRGGWRVIQAVRPSRPLPASWLVELSEILPAEVQAEAA